MPRIGIISDTHGLMRPEALGALEGVERIIHAGDIGGSHILTELGRVAPVTAVKGNNDKGSWSEAIPSVLTLEIGAHAIYVIHDLAQMDVEPRSAGFAIVISGHSHQPSVDRRDNVLYLNPGSAGPRRFRLPISIATLEIDGTSIDARIHELTTPRK